MIGYHCSHEQHPPSRLLEFVRAAESAGFGAAMCSDHLAPWSTSQGQSGFAWSWLGSALQATELDFGTVNAPGQRYHPVVIAQAAATLAEMYPGRFWLALGTGEALNEHVTGDAWPDKAARRVRLRESVDLMRALFAGETVTHRATFVRPEDMYTAVRISADPGRHRAWRATDHEIGFDRIFVHHVGMNQLRFIETFSKAVLPGL